MFQKKNYFVSFRKLYIYLSFLNKNNYVSIFFSVQTLFGSLKTNIVWWKRDSVVKSTDRPCLQRL